eukprot:scaffold4946_cov106-Cylindrotheca_fusiformis.AAC.1
MASTTGDTGSDPSAVELTSHPTVSQCSLKSSQSKWGFLNRVRVSAAAQSFRGHSVRLRTKNLQEPITQRFRIPPTSAPSGATPTGQVTPTGQPIK